MAALTLWLLPLEILVIVVLYRTLRIIANYVEARKIGIPIVLSPISQREAWWVLMRKRFTWIEKLPFGLGSWYPYTNPGWPVPDRCQSHERYGEAFAIVSPGATHISLSGTAACEKLYHDWKTWITVPEITEIFGICGPNALMVNGEDWQRHRKIMSASFTERNLKLVWDESKRQYDQMKPVVASRQGRWMFADIRHDVEVLALHVLSAAAFGTHNDFSGGVKTLTAGHERSFVDALGFILNNLFLALVSKRFSGMKFLAPPRIKEMMSSIDEFKTYLREMIAEQKHANDDTCPSSSMPSNLLAAMVRANEDLKQESPKQPGRTFHLSEDEMLGNLFFMNMAGHVTTASTLIFTLSFLALNPDVQTWAREEVDRVVAKRGSLDMYEECFADMPRCLALMHESLRLFSPVIQVTRHSLSPQTLPLRNGEKLFVPPGTQLCAEEYAMHLDTQTWGEDAGEYAPKRWLKIGNESEDGEKGEVGEEVFDGPPQGAGYLPWLSGPRRCPGAKFSQVEFVCVMSHILVEFEVEPMLMGGGQEAEARERLFKSLMESDFKGTPRPTTPEEVGVRLVPRRG